MKSRLSASDFPDMRGRHAPIHKTNESTIQSIIDHIESYHPSVSHYRRKHAPLRRYLPSRMTVAEIHSKGNIQMKKYVMNHIDKFLYQ